MTRRKRAPTIDVIFFRDQELELTMAEEVMERWRRTNVDSKHDKDIEAALREGKRDGGRSH
jgi:hypothetical protein